MKPRIRKLRSGMYACFGVKQSPPRWVIGYGPTPQDAYRDWFNTKGELPCMINR